MGINMKISSTFHSKVILLILISFGMSVSATESQSEIELLKQQIKLLTQRIEKLESQSNLRVQKIESTDAQVVTAARPSELSGVPKVLISSNADEAQQSTHPATKTIADRLSFKADFRERYEIINQQGKADRDRNRVRLRAALTMKIDESIGFTLGIATGGDDPVSTNQTFDDAFSTKDLRLDFAYFDYQLNDIFKLTGGKMKNPFYRPGKNSSFWDSDLNPEGLALKFDSGHLQASIVGFSVEERKAAADTYLLGTQVMRGFKVSDKSNLTLGAGYYNYSHLKGNQPLFDGQARGNSLDDNDDYATDFDIAELFVEYTTRLGGKPFSVFGNYFKNTAANALDTAYTFGFNYGKVNDAGSWDIGMAYLDTDADSVVALFNDSDFAGGNSDAKGITLKAGYGIRKNVSLGLRYIDSELGQSRLEQTNYQRLQLDLKLKFK